MTTKRPTRGATWLTLTFVPTTDTEITCIACCSPDPCDYEAQSLPGPGNRAWVGLHKRCLMKYREPHATKRRLAACVARWPDCAEGAYDPRCCRFPKSCSCDVYDPATVTETELEPKPPK